MEPNISLQRTVQITMSISAPQFAAYESTTCVPSLLAHARGTVLEIGPGCGSQMPYYDFSSITKIIALEPNKAFQEDLRRRAKELDVTDKYTVASAEGGIEAWILDWNQKRAAGKAADERLDCVVCMQVLCSLSTDLVARTVKGLWEILEPGGELIFWEHIASEDFAARKMQGLPPVQQM